MKNEKVIVNVVTYSMEDGGEGVESVHKTKQGAEARVKKVYEEAWTPALTISINSNY